MPAAPADLLQDSPEEERRVRMKPWVSPWSLDDEWDDAPPPVPPPPRPAEARPRRAAAQMPPPPAVAQIIPAPEPDLDLPAPARIKPVRSPAPSAAGGAAEIPGKPPERAAEKPPVAERAAAKVKQEVARPEVVQRGGGVVRLPSFSWAAPILMSLGLLGMTFVAWLYWQDVPLETDEDLHLSWPVDQAVKISAPRRLRSFLNSVGPAADPALMGQSPWQWTTPALSEFVGGRGAAFDNLRDLLEDYDWHPRHSSWHISDLGADPAWPRAALLLQAQAAYLVRRGDEESAFTTAIDLAELSRRLQDLWAWPSFAARSHELHAACVQTLAELLKRTRLESARLEPFQTEFANCAPSRAVLQDALSAYYLHEKKLLLGAQSGQPLDTMPYGLTQRRPGRLLFKMNRTLNLFGDAFRELKAEAAAKPGASFAYAGERVRRTRQTAPQFYQPNAAGERYFSDRIDLYLDLPERHNLAQARHQLVLGLFAVRRYMADHQRLPPGLSALKPRYMAEVPADPFSGEPLHYDRLKGRLFSVGVNRVAEGGMVTEPPLNEPKEPTLELGIGAAALVK